MINYENDLREIALNLLDSAGVYYKSNIILPFSVRI